MIDVTYHRKYNRLTIEGHAMSGESGHDLVCAAASCLAITLASNVAGLISSNAVKKHCIRLEEGSAEVACEPVRKMSSVVTLIYDTVCTGFDTLQQLYPENISYQVLG